MLLLVVMGGDNAREKKSLLAVSNSNVSKQCQWLLAPEEAA